MPDHEFEKKIQDKMAELKVRPSDPVWQRVEKELNKKEKRRRGILWLPVLIAAVSAGYFFVDRWSFNNDVSQKKQPATAARHITELEKKIDEKAKLFVVRQEEGVIQDPMIARDRVQGFNRAVSAKSRFVAIKQETDEPHALAGKKHRPDKSNVTNEESNSFIDDGKVKPPAVPGEIKQWKQLKKIDTEAADTAFITETEPLREPRPSAGAGKTLMHGQVDLYTSIHAPLTKSEVRNMPHRHRNAEFGFAFTAGRSHINNGQLPSLFISDLVPSNRSYSYITAPQSAGGNGGSVTSYLPPSKLKPALGFSAGSYLKTPLSKKLRLSIALNYKFYSSSNKLGAYQDTLIPSNSFNGAQLSDLTKVYHTGNDNQYTNRFHFIEVPVSLEGRLINGKLPLYWSTGISYSRLIASNALHYDNDFRLYYKDNKLLQKGQLNINAGLNMVLFKRSEKPFLIGPEFSYGLTDILRIKTNAPKHFLFLGIKASLAVSH